MSIGTAGGSGRYGVKRSENGVIVNPFFLGPDNLVREADEIMGRLKYPACPSCRDGVLVGIIPNRDMRFMEGDDRSAHQKCDDQDNLNSPRLWEPHPRMLGNPAGLH